jgi:hypothetical protein
MKHIGFLSFGHWTPSPQSQTRSAEDALLQTIKLAVAAEELGADGGRSYTAEPDVLIEQLKATMQSPRPTRCCSPCRTNSTSTTTRM